MKLKSAKQKGRDWEQAIATYLVANGFPYAERRRQSGTNDQGDIAGVPDVMIEAKNESAPSVGTYMQEVTRQMRNAKARVGVAWVKRPGATDAGRGVVLVYGELLTDLGYLGDVTDYHTRLAELLLHESVLAPPGRVLLVRRLGNEQRAVVAMSGATFVSLIRPVTA